ncbi:uncharacterized protein LOC119196324 [Pungitius pungitius]|uniref:uncharacterized protein LOC119196324 n=1 Tax=Pungitius pungitius TaxID=134920 RepID=UPI002E12B073
MALPFGVSWICNLLFWGCICFPSQKGCSIAHGYYLNENDFSSHVGVPGPQPSNQFNSLFLNPNQDSANLRDEMQSMRNQRFVSRPREPVRHENHEEASFARSLGDVMANGKPASEQHVPSAPPSSKYENDASDPHPLNILVSEHRQAKNMAGPSFLSIKDFKKFTELMKSAFLMPGTDLDRHFQTAQETIRKEMASNAQNMNIKRQHDTGQRSSAEGAARDDLRGNEAWRAAASTAVERGANHQMPRESPSVPDTIDPTASPIPPSVHDTRGHGPGSAVPPLHHLAATENVSRNYGGFDSGGISRDNSDLVTRAPPVRNEAVQSSAKIPGRIPYGSLVGHDWSLSRHLTAPGVNSQNRPPQDFSHYSRPTSEKNIRPEPKYTAHSEDSTMETQKPSHGLELARGLPSRGTSGQILSAPMRTPLSSHGRVLKVPAPRGRLYSPEDQPEHDPTLATPSPGYRYTGGQPSNDLHHMPTAHLPPATVSVSSSSNNPSPHSSILFGVQNRSPLDAHNLSFKRKKPVRFYTRFTGQPSSSHGSSKPHGHLRRNEPS